jgi:beta-lactam-binding protein with PASTA domain
MFVGWAGACTGKAVCVLSMQANRSVAATFLKNCLVPKLTGKSVATARHDLLANGCTVGTIKRVDSFAVKGGRVISQQPAPGRHRAHGARVNLLVSKARP